MYSAGCEEAMHALEECHARGWLTRITGGCNNAKTVVNRCLREARLQRTQENHEKSKEKNAKLRSAWAEIDANS
jgi:COX assembly protein 2